MKNKSLVSEHIYSRGNEEFKYKLRLSRRAKIVQLQINQEGELHVVLPFRIRSFDHISFIHSKTDWILKHITPSSKKVYYYLGKEIILQPCYNLFASETEYRFFNNILLINIQCGSNQSLNSLYQNWLYIKAEEYLIRRSKELAAKYDLVPQRITIRRQKTRWGSCSFSGIVSLNCKLMILRKELIDYVITHELCHLSEFNHSKNFWKLVKQFVPDHSALRKELRELRFYN
ncbi:MAG: M48 family metallopeptidase [Ignavibacteriaceae bacterium]